MAILGAPRALSFLNGSHMLCVLLHGYHFATIRAQDPSRLGSLWLRLYLILHTAFRDLGKTRQLLVQFPVGRWRYFVLAGRKHVSQQR